MSLVLLTPPAVEPVSLAEAKAHLRIDATDEDVLIQNLILTSRIQIETALSLALVTQLWTLKLGCWPRDGIVEVPITPLQSVSMVRVRSTDGTVTVVANDHYEVDAAARPARIYRHPTAALASGRRFGGIEIDFTAGFGGAAADVPASIRRALLHLVAHWFENREPSTLPAVPPPIPDTVSELLWPFRTVRL